MKILAWDTSSSTLSIALLSGEKIIASSDSADMPSDTLIPMIDKLLKQHRLTINAVDCLAVGIGPGSFTGLRVGVMSAKMIGYSLGVPLVGISSMEAIAFGAKRFNQPVAVMQDARKNQIYGAVYEFVDGKTKMIQKPILTTAEDFLSQIKESAVIVKDTPLKAESIARLAAGRIKAKKFTKPENLKPLYLHPKDCNVTK